MKLQKTVIGMIALFIFALTASAQVQFRKKLDFNNDNKADIVQFSEEFRNSQNANYFYIAAQGPNDGYRAVRWGTANILSSSGDKPVAGDFDGTGGADFAVVRSEGSNQVWYILNSAQTSYQRVVFGVVDPSGDRFDTPVVADYDGDAKDDIAVARREFDSEGYLLTYYWLRSSDGQLGYRQFRRSWNEADGFCNATVPGDYDKDGKADFVQRCVRYQDSQMFFKINYNASNQTQQIDWGLFFPNGTGDQFAPGDYDGDGKTDLAVIRAVGTSAQSNWVWYIRRTSDGSYLVKYFGGSAETGDAASSYYDVAAPADYDGDGKTDVAVTRGINDGLGSSRFVFIIQSSQTGALRYVPFGRTDSELRYDNPLAAMTETSNSRFNAY